jgi:hypothetical protein
LCKERVGRRIGRRAEEDENLLPKWTSSVGTLPKLDDYTKAGREATKVSVGALLILYLDISLELCQEKPRL